MKKERERKEYLEFVEQFQAFLILMTEEWGAKVTLQKDGEEEPEDLLVVELRGDGPGIHIQRFHMAEIYPVWNVAGRLRRAVRWGIWRTMSPSGSI